MGVNKRSVVLIMAVLMTGFLALIPGKTCFAMTDYWVDEGNGLYIETKENEAPPTATILYRTKEWFIFPKEIQGYKKIYTEEDWRKLGYPLPLAPENLVSSTKGNGSSVYFDVYQIPAENLIPMILKWYSTDGKIDRQQLIDGVQVYASRSLLCVENGVVRGPYYCYKTIAEQADWRGNTLRVFREAYDHSLFISFHAVQLGIETVIVRDGQVLEEEPEGYQNLYELDALRLYGETIESIPYPGYLPGYRYLGYEWVTDTEAIVAKGEGNRSCELLINRKELAETDKITLRFLYEKSKVVAGETPVPGPEMTEPPQPTVLPAEPHIVKELVEKFYTTDAGYTMEMIVSDEKNEVARKSRITVPITEHYFTRNEEFFIGTDEEGNQWFFLKEGENAVYVHPYIYNGYDATSSQVKYITELKFPERIIADGNDYPVTHIGGGTTGYREPEEQDGYRYDISFGSYEYCKETASSVTGYEAGYMYGVLGNGYVETEYTYERVYEDGRYSSRDVVRNYTVHNTTLKRVTVPDTVTEIGACAFMYCMALEEISGGEKVAVLDYGAFCADSAPVVYNTGNYVSETGDDCFCEYYYNGEPAPSYGLSQSMRDWQKAVQYKEILWFPKWENVLEIGDFAFAFHTNLRNVELPQSVERVGNAFWRCGLDRIVIYGAPSLSEDYRALGSKGAGKEKTLLYTTKEAEQVIAYGRKYREYYDLKAGYRITYDTNQEEKEIRKDITVLEDACPEFVLTEGVECGTEPPYSLGIEEDGSLWMNGMEVGKLEAMPAEIVKSAKNEDAGVYLYYYDNDNKLWYVSLDWQSDIRTYEIERQQSIVFAAGMKQIDRMEASVLYYTAQNGEGYAYSTIQNRHVLCREKKNFVRTFLYGTALAGAEESGKLYYSGLKNWYSISRPSGVTACYAWKESPVGTCYNENAEEEITCYVPGGVVDAYGYLWVSQDNIWKRYYAGLFGDMKLQGVSHDGDTGYVLVWEKAKETLSLLSIPEDTSVAMQLQLLGSLPEKWTDVIVLKRKYDTYYVPHYYILQGESGAVYVVSCLEHTIERIGGKNFYAEKLECITEGEFASYTEAEQKPYEKTFLRILNTKGELWNVMFLFDKVVSENISNGFSYADFLIKTGISSKNSYRIDCLGELALGLQGQLYMRRPKDVYRGYTGEYQKITTGERATKLLTYEEALYQNGVIRIKHPLWQEPYRVETVSYDKGYRFVHKISDIYQKREGYLFTGWNTKTDGSGTVYVVGKNYYLQDDLTLFAQWKRIQSRIHYRANGGSGSMADTILPFGETTVQLAENQFKRLGYRFAGWNTRADGTGTGYADRERLTNIKQNITLYAQWEPLVTEYTLLYMKYPIDSAENEVWKEKKLVNTVGENGVEASSVERIEGQPYEPGNYKVTYDLNAPTATVQPWLQKITEANTQVTAPGFRCWRLYAENEQGKLVYTGRKFSEGQRVKRLTEKDGATVILYPSWSEAETYVILPKATCTGYEMSGWSEEKDGTGKIYTVFAEESTEIGVYTPSRDVTLYAIWESDGKAYTDFQVTSSTDRVAAEQIRAGLQAVTLKKGYAFSYTVFTGGARYENAEKIKITPTYYYIFEDGTRERAYLYYYTVQNGKKQLTEAGGTSDDRNGQKNGVITLSVGKPEKSEVSGMETVTEWKGKFSLPSVMYAVLARDKEKAEKYLSQETISGQEAFFQKEGYLTVSFQIEVQVKTEEGEKLILYETWEDTKVWKDMLAAGWNAEHGDVVRYDLSKSVADDYEVGGVE